MATATRIQLSPSHKPVYCVPSLTQESADTASKLLQENHENFHIFFNSSGFHNHIAHGLLTLYALGATPPELQKHYDNNKSYQRPLIQRNREAVDMSTHFSKYLGNSAYYSDYKSFFERSIESKGWQNVLNEYLFRDNERANDLLVRTFAGVLHPLIHLGFGVEFEQPAIIAEALAQAAIHDAWPSPLLLGAEKLAREQDLGSDTSIFTILDKIRADKELVNSVQWSDGNKIRDGILKRALNPMTKYAAQFTVKTNEIEEKMAEMVNLNAYITSASQRPSRRPKIDFYHMHSLNCSIFFPAFLTSPTSSWLSPNSKARLLEWKVRFDLALYVARGSAKLLPSEVTEYRPNVDANWETLISRVRSFEDDGHASKLLRAIAYGEQLCSGLDAKAQLRFTADMWRRFGLLAVDSTDGPGSTWVYDAGFDRAWESVPGKKDWLARLS